MRDKFVFESFKDFINYKLLMTEAKSEKIERMESQTTPWEFNFDSGKFKKSDITEDQLKNIESDFKKKIVPLFNNQKYTGQKMEITISASSSKVPINPTGSVAKELKAEGYSADNEGLCKARGNTISGIIKDLIYENFSDGKENKEDFIKELDSKMIITNSPSPNIGPDYDKSKGDNPDDQKYRDNQYISATLKIVGEKIPEDKFLPCGVTREYSGKQGTIANGFAGYDKTIFLRTKAGQKMEIFFDPVTIPDAILFSYSGKDVKLSPFSGSYGSKYISGVYTKELETKLNKDAASGKTIKPKKEVIGGITYLVSDYKDYLNNVVNKDGILVKSIESKLKSLGLKPIKDICPEFFDDDGKIEVYRNKDLSQIKLTPDSNSLTYDMLKSGEIKQSPKASTQSLSISITKNAVRDAVTLVAFSPLSGTIFSLRTVCS
jgi:hypothetical protein